MRHIELFSWPHKARRSSGKAGRREQVAAWLRTLLCCLPACLLSSRSFAQEWQDPETGWFIRGGAKVLFNIKASVTKLPKKIRSGYYDNGYVLPDAGGVVSDKTWNWGFDSDDQINGNLLEMDLLTDLPKFGSFEDETDDPSVGAEVMFGSSLYEFEIRESVARVGWELGYAFNEVSIEQSSRATSMATLTTTSFDATGITFPSAPYRGNADGPGPLITRDPAFPASTLTSPATGSSSGELQAYLHVLKLGIWFDYEWNKRLLTSCSFGYASIFTDAQWKYTESVYFDDPGIDDITPGERTVGHQDWKPGVYWQCRAHYRFNSLLEAYLGGEFHTSEDMDFKEGGYRVVLDYGALFGVTGGLSFRF